jgi:hypothetical protein
MKSLWIAAAIALLGPIGCKSDSKGGSSQGAGKTSPSASDDATNKGDGTKPGNGSSGSGGAAGSASGASGSQSAAGAGNGSTPAQSSGGSKTTKVDEVADTGTPTPFKTYEAAKEDRPLGVVLCEEGPGLSERQNDDFSAIFASICENGAPNATFDRIAASAYAGEGEPQIEIMKGTTDEMYVTHLMFAYAVKIPIDSPGKVADLNLFQAFEQGLSDGVSKMTYQVDGRTTFPGKGSLEEVRVTYRTLVADGAAVYDKRQTYSNQYLPSEATRDITVTMESLADAENNEHYHATRQLSVGMKNSEGTTTMIYVSEMIIKNRIDPPRIQRSLYSLTKVLAKTTYDIAAAAQN